MFHMYFTCWLTGGFKLFFFFGCFEHNAVSNTGLQLSLPSTDCISFEHISPVAGLLDHVEIPFYISCAIFHNDCGNLHS